MSLLSLSLIFQKPGIAVLGSLATAAKNGSWFLSQNYKVNREEILRNQICKTYY